MATHSLFPFFALPFTQWVGGALLFAQRMAFGWRWLISLEPDWVSWLMIWLRWAKLVWRDWHFFSPRCRNEILSFLLGCMTWLLPPHYSSSSTFTICARCLSLLSLGEFDFYLYFTPVRLSLIETLALHMDVEKWKGVGVTSIFHLKILEIDQALYPTVTKINTPFSSKDM